MRTPTHAEVLQVADAFLGLPRVKLSELKEGDRLVVNHAFACIQPWTTVEVQRDEEGLFVPCKWERHYLDGEDLVGFRRAK